MIAYRTFTEQLDSGKDLLVQQNHLRDQFVAFINEAIEPKDIIEINEMILPHQQFVLTVWYKLQLVEADANLTSQPEAQSADVLSRSLREQERRDRISSMVDEHIIRSNSS